MNSKELLAVLAAKTRSTKADADLNVLALIEIISETLEKGGEVNLKGFGSFHVHERAVRVGRNPKTGETIQVKATRVPAFKPGARLKTALNGVVK